MVRAAAAAGGGPARGDAQRAAREEPARHGGAGRSRGRRFPPNLDPALREGRSIDGTNNDLALPADGLRPAAASAATSRSSTRVPDAANLLVPNPRVVSRELMTREEFQPATILNLLAAAWIQFMVHDWFVHERSKTDVVEIPTQPGDDLGEPSIRVPRPVPRPGARGFDAAAGLRQPEQPLVGRVADLRQRRGHAAKAPHAHRRQAAHGADRAAAGRSRDRRALHRVHRQLVDRPGDAPHPVHAGAQPHLRSARAPASELERRSALSQGQADQLGADGQDPHRRVDDRHRAASRSSSGR